MKKKQNKFALLCFLLLVAVAGCGKKVNDIQPSQNTEQNSKSSSSETVSSPPLLSGWKKFSSEAGNFSVLFPNEPREKDQQLGQIIMHAFAAQKDIQNGFGVCYCDFRKSPNAKSLLDEMQAATVGNQAKIVSQQDMNIGNYPAREFEFVEGGKANYSARMRMILVGQRLYMLNVIFLTGNPHPDERDAYFNSFSLLKN